MFRSFKGILEALQALVPAIITIAGALKELCDKVAQYRDLTERVDVLERTRALWEADIEAQGVKLEARNRALRATEERIRLANRRADEADEDAEASGGAPPQAAWPQFDAPYAGGSDPTAVPSVRPRVADRGAATAKKWGR